MNMQSQIRLVAEAGSLHPLKSHLLGWPDEAEESIPAHRRPALPMRRTATATDDEREAELRNVAVHGYN